MSSGDNISPTTCRQDSAHHTESLAAPSETCMPMTGSDAFARRCRSLDHRPVWYRFIKRTFDIVFSACVVIIGLIPGLILALIIMLDTKGSPIYSQMRIGRDGRPFRIYKFRSMVADADNVEKYFTPEQLDVWKSERKVENDPRITHLGYILRKMSLDELPQFINVLLGQISVIGPRAITKDELAHFGDDAPKLLSVTPGITGAWQCGPRNEATFENGERQRVELEYVRDASLLLDAQIFFSTFTVMFGKKKTGR